MRKKNILCDVTLLFDDGQRLPAHKLMLAASSRYFKRYKSVVLSMKVIVEKENDQMLNNARNLDDAVLMSLIQASI